jgi:hypothetical protein
MGLTTNGLPAAAASGNRTVAVVARPDGGLVMTSWELGGQNNPWTTVSVEGTARPTNVAPAVSFRTTFSGATVWLGIKEAATGQIFETLQVRDGTFLSWGSYRDC